MKTLWLRTYLLVALMVLCTTFANGAAVTWDGGGATNNWSEGANWVGDVAPQNIDEVIFDSTSTKDVTIDVDFMPLRFNMNAGYSGTISLGASTINVISHFNQVSGTFLGGTGTLNVGGDFSLSGGTFTATSGTTTFSGDFLISGAGDFEHNGGTVTFRSDNAQANILDTEDFFNLTVNKTNNSSGLFIGVGDTLRVNGHLTLTNGQLSGAGTIEAPNTITIAATFDGGDGLLLINGNAT